MTRLDDELRIAKDKYTKDNANSLKLHLQAKSLLPGGNTRSVLYNDPFPILIKSGHGSYVIDEDGHQYVDLVGEMSAGIYGHNHPVILKLVKYVCEEIGLSLGGSTRYEQDLAREIQRRFPLMERIRFCNSGTELNLQNLIAAKHFTGKSKIICFQGAYHGGPLSFAHGISKYNIDHKDFILCRYNDIDNFNQVFNENKDSLAGVIVEAMLGAGGCISGSNGFLENIQAKCRDNNIVFILDEVMTSRLSYGGLQLKYKLKPDLVSLGKYIGGGFTFGSFGGRQEIMSCFDPTSGHCLSHSGTFNNNTMTMYVGLQGLTKIFNANACCDLNLKGDRLRFRLRDYTAGTKMCVSGIGSTMNIHFTENGECYDTVYVSEHSLNDLRQLFWFDMISRGYWIANRGMINLNVETSVTDIDDFANAVETWVRDRYEFIKL